MSKLDELCNQLSAADLTLMVLIEDAAGLGRHATARSLAAAINGAPVASIGKYLDRLRFLGAIEAQPCRVTSIGAGALERLVDDWEPAFPEHMRREAELVAAAEVRS